MRDLDARVAMEVMGWTIGQVLRPHGDCDGLAYLKGDTWSCLPPFSSDIAAAFQIIDKMRADGWHWEVGEHYTEDKRWARFARGYYDQYDDHWSEDYLEAASNVAEAICLAALAAVGREGER